MPMGMPWWPDLALFTASMVSTRMALAIASGEAGMGGGLLGLARRKKGRGGGRGGFAPRLGTGQARRGFQPAARAVYRDGDTRRAELINMTKESASGALLETAILR